MQDLLSHIIRISSRGVKSTQASLGMASISPWSWTNAETLKTESALLPLLIHLAAAHNDVEGLRWCINSMPYGDLAIQSLDTTRAAGIVNCQDAASARSPLHIAVLHGHSEAAFLLLKEGASVHIRDMLGHTALYYVSFVFGFLPKLHHLDLGRPPRS